MPPRSAFLASLFACSLAACTQFPELETGASTDHSAAAYPPLLPLEDLLAAPTPRATPEAQNAVDSRADALRRRASELRRPVLEPDSRNRLDPGQS